MKPVRWGVLGAANIALRKVIPAMQQSSLCDVVAIASRDIAKARRAAQQLGIARAYGSYDELIDDADIEAIYNPLPNHLHVPWSIRAAEAGKHVLCEKPIALNAAEARELLAVRDRTGVLITEAFMVRTHPQWLKVRELVQSGALGELRLVSGHFSYFKTDPENIRNKVEWGGGGLMDIGCYLTMLARWLFAAEPLEVCASIERDPATGVDRLVTAMLRFERAHASFTCATQLAPAQYVDVFGTNGHITVETPFNAPPDKSVRILLNDESIVFDAVDQYPTQGDEFSRAVRGIGEAPVALEDAVANMAVIDALFSSGETGTWQRL